ncbi:nucleotide-diphospho-sugar transferase [Hesseltinella vesiculosa]|uniref:Translation initiation factor eIF2B subunit gamma n=1 Tax=Hesseltinella vesiculosa TaxID=101127 RepID=A0A1X2GLV7_9FUNG|nr:nucleotide-diphospho-sugar transferase [Hesseltinella vesiculosa]
MSLLFEKTKHQRQCEFQAVILAGYGSSNKLYPISEDENLPKALLPVGNRPMIAYTLDWLEMAGIFDAIVVIQSTGNAQQKLSGYITRNYTGNVHCNVVGVAEDCGTAEALRAIKDKIAHDFIVVPCDLITELDPRNLLDQHRLRDTTLTALFYAPGESAKDDEALPFVGIDPTRQALVYKSEPMEDDDISIRMSLLTKFPRVRLHTNLQDAHLYIFKRWVLDMLADKEYIASISDDLIPMLVKCQYQKKMVDREQVNKYASGYQGLLQTALALSTTYSNDVDEDVFMPDPIHSSFKSPVTTQVYVYRDGFCGRGNTLDNYAELNRHVIKQGTPIMRVPPTSEVAPKTQVGNDSIIGEHTKIDERSSVKKSSVGAHCIIGKNVKIANSVIMDSVVIGDNVKVDGCIICNHAKVLEKTILKDCEVANDYVVEKESQIKGEKLVAFRQAMA